MAEIDSRLEQIEVELRTIKERNRRVELEKLWETSITRKGAVVFLTYVVMVLAFVCLGAREPFSNAVVPTLGYFLSTQGLPIVKRWWLQRKTTAQDRL